ncbi:hypothetical protein BCR44DRAFT_1435754, partial [Catenaria anguillulae PL171]
MPMHAIAPISPSIPLIHSALARRPATSLDLTASEPESGPFSCQWWALGIRSVIFSARPRRMSLVSTVGAAPSYAIR